MSQDRASETGCAALVEAKLPALRALCRSFGVRRLDLFGSAATGRFDPARSDLDFLVEFESMPPGGYAHAYFGLLEQLEARLSLVWRIIEAKFPHLRTHVERLLGTAPPL